MDENAKYSRIQLWHKGIVYYKYGSSIAKERSHSKTANITAKIKKAIEMFQEQTPVKWIEVSDADSKQDFHEFELVTKGRGNSLTGLYTQEDINVYNKKKYPDKPLSRKIKVEEDWGHGNITHELCHTIARVDT